MAVVGKDVPYPLLRAIAAAEGTRDALTEDALRVGLGHLQAAEFIYEASLFPTLEYTFKHALTYEVAYNSLLQERRKALHARIVRAFETLYPERLGEHALRYARQAGLKGVSRSANREAVTFFEQALSALEHLPESRSTLEQAIDLRLDMRQAL